MVLTRGLKLPVSIGLLLPGVASGVRAQTTADHAALAHGHPIVGGKDIQPTPQVVQGRLRHHRLMLQAERDQAAGRSPPKRRTGETKLPAKAMGDGRP